MSGPLNVFQQYVMLTVSLLFSDQGAGHAEEGVPCAGGDVRRGDGRMSVICRGESGNTQSRPARDSEKRIVPSEEGENVM